MMAVVHWKVCIYICRYIHYNLDAVFWEVVPWVRYGCLVMDWISTTPKGTIPESSSSGQLRASFKAWGAEGFLCFRGSGSSEFRGCGLAVGGNNCQQPVEVDLRRIMPGCMRNMRHETITSVVIEASAVGRKECLIAMLMDGPSCVRKSRNCKDLHITYAARQSVPMCFWLDTSCQPTAHLTEVFGDSYNTGPSIISQIRIRVP